MVGPTDKNTIKSGTKAQVQKDASITEQKEGEKQDNQLDVRTKKTGTRVILTNTRRKLQFRKTTEN